MKKLTPTLLSLALLALLPLLFLWRVALAGDVLISLDMLMSYEPWHSELPGAIAVPLWNELAADTVRNYYPAALHITESWRRGVLPAWYPYAGNGLPLLGAGFFQALYPLNVLLWLAVPVHRAFGWSAILHLFLGSLFTYLFVRELGAGNFGRLVAAIAFTYCGSLVIWLGVPSVVDSMVWLPLAFWGFEAALVRRDWRWLAVGAVGGALQIMGGHVQLALYGFTGLGLYGLGRAGLAWWERRAWRRACLPLLYAALVIGVGSGLAAYQLLPTMELLPRIIRSDIAFDVYTPPQNLLRIFSPDVLGVHMDGEVMPGFRQEAYLYVGLLTLFLAAAALFSPRRGVAASLVGIGGLFLLVIYNVPPFFQLFYYLYPAFRTVGFTRTMFVISFLWAAAAGLGADWLLTARPRRVLRGLIGGGLVMGGVVVVYMLGLFFLAKYRVRHFWALPPVPEVQPGLDYHLGTLFIFLVTLGLIILLFWQWRRGGWSRPVFVGVALGLLVGDLFLAHIDRVPVLPESMLYPTTPSLAWLQETLAQESELYRVSGTGRVLWPGTAGALQIPAVGAYTSFPLKRYDEYAQATGVRADSNFRVVTYRPQANRLLDALNVKYLYASRDDLPGSGWLSLIEDVGTPQVVSDRAGAGEVAFWNIDNWTQPVLQAPASTSLSFLGPLPEVATLETAIAIQPEQWAGGAVLFEIYSGTAAEPLQERLFSHLLDPGNNPDHRAWVPVTVRLAGRGAEPVLVSLVTRSQAAEPGLAGWADPLLRPDDLFELRYYGPNTIYLNQNYLPRAWAVHTATEVAFDDRGAVAERLAAPGFDPAVEAVVEGRLPAALGRPGPDDKVAIQEYGLSEVVIRTRLAGPGVVVLSDIYYPGWVAYVDGVEQPLYPANLAMRAVFVAEGEHTVRLLYRPRSFRLGLALSGGVTGLVGLALGGDFIRRRFILGKAHMVK